MALVCGPGSRKHSPLPQSGLFAYFSHLQITICAYCLCDLRHAIQLYLIYGHVFYGTPAFVKQKIEISKQSAQKCEKCKLPCGWHSAKSQKH
jgi:hypothetical protein